jgi:hypothetical protein
MTPVESPLITMESFGTSLAGDFVNLFNSPEKSPHPPVPPNNEKMDIASLSNMDIASLPKTTTVLPTSAPTKASPLVQTVQTAAPQKKKSASAPKENTVAPSAPTAEPTPSKGSGLCKKLVVVVLMLVVGAIAACGYAHHSPKSKVGAHVQTCAAKLGVEKELKQVGEKVGAVFEKPSNVISSGTTTFLKKFDAEVKKAQETQEAHVSEANQGMVESALYAVGAAVTSGMGYGVYWLMTQG